MCSLSEKIKEAKSVLGDSFPFIVAKELGVDINEKTLTIKSLWNTDENTPSMVFNKKNNSFHDFSTGKNMDFIDYCIEFKHMNFHQSVEELFKLTNVEYDKNDFKNVSHDEYFENYKFPVRKDFDRTECENYWNLRGISTNTLDYFDVTADEYGNTCFNCYDEDNRLLLVKVRPSHKVSKGQSKEWCQKDADTTPVLFNMNKIDITKPLVICEGFGDAMSVYECGITNVTTVPLGCQNHHWIDWNYEWLKDIPEIILYFDNDAPGISAMKEVSSRLGEYRIKIVKPGKEIQDDVEQYYKQYNQSISIRKTDANNVLLACGKDKLMNCIINATEIPNEYIKDLSTYDEMDIQSLPRHTTGISALDRDFYGIFKNSLNIITGKSGCGKSSLVNQVGIITPIECGEKVAVFSGEASAPILLSQLFAIMAGPRHVIVWDNGEDSPKGYTATNESKKYMKKFLKGKVYIFDDTNYEMLASATKLLEQMEYAYKRYGVTNFVIDNLMCLSFDGSSEDTNEKQKDFVIRLKTFTNKYPVSVILVAHTRKMQNGERGDQYDVAGSSNIVNVCDRCFFMDILRDDKEGYNNKVESWKDRVGGIVGKINKMYYDKGTRRIYSTYSERDRVYQWEKEYGDEINYSSTVKNRLLCNQLTSYEEVYEDDENNEILPY